MKLPRFAYALMLWVIVSAGLLRAQGPFAISGTIVTPRGVLENGTMVVAKGKIVALGTNVSVPRGTPLIKVDGVVFPGLIDLHNHLVWNVFPRWKLPVPVTTRYEWQAMPEYAARLSGPEGVMIGKGLGCDMERYAEVKALLGGATSVVGSYGPSDTDPNRNECDKGLARNLDVFSGLYSDHLNAEPVRYEVFPFEISWQQAQAIRDALGNLQLKSVIFHVGEGKDASAAREFRMLKARGFLRPGVNVIHGVALKEAEFREMGANGVGFIWSPRSNIELYGKTADVESAKVSQVTMALAPDWSPTGSSGLLDELRYAYKWNIEQKPEVFNDSDFLRMVTANPARLAGANDQIGSLASGMMADFIVLPKKGSDALRALVDAEPATIKLVVVGGHPLLGDPDTMRQFNPGKDFELLTVCGHQKALDILDDTNGQSFAAIESHLTHEMQPLGTELASLSECK